MSSKFWHVNTVGGSEVQIYKSSQLVIQSQERNPKIQPSKGGVYSLSFLPPGPGFQSIALKER